MPDDPCVELTARQTILLAQSEAANIILQAAQQAVDDVSVALMINTMNLVSNGCIPDGGMMMATADSDDNARSAVKAAMRKPELREGTFNKYAVAKSGLAKLLESVKTADANVTAK